MERERFEERFRAAAREALIFARTFVKDYLPDSIRFRVRLNSSYDGNPLHVDERRFDGDAQRDHELRACSESQALEVLYRDGWVPEWIDLAVRGLRGQSTLMDVQVCGRFTRNDELLYDQPPAKPPFHVLGPDLPDRQVGRAGFSVHWSFEAWDAEDLETLRDCAREVELLTLSGAAFDDASLSALPDLPRLRSLILLDVPLCGATLATLARFPALSTLRVETPHADFSLASLPPLPALDTLLVDLRGGTPRSLWRCSVPDGALAGLRYLEVRSAGPLVLESELPAALETLHLGAASLELPALPPSLRNVHLAIPGADGAQLDGWLLPLTQLRKLGMSGAQVDDAYADTLMARWPLRFLDVTDTQVSEAMLKRLRADHPQLRVRPVPADGGS